MAKAKGLKQSLPGLLRFLKYLGPYIKGRRWLIAAAFAGLLGQTLLRLLEPWPLKYIIDRLAQPAPSAAEHLELLASLDTSAYFAILAIALVAITGIRAFMTYATTVSMALAGNHVIIALRGKLFSHLQGLSSVFHQQQRGGDLVVRIISDMGLIKEVAITAAVPLIGNGFIFVSIVAVMLWLNWQLALLSLCTLPLLWLITLKKSRRIHTVAKKNRQREGVMAATASESINSIKAVQALRLEERFSTIFSDANNKSLKEGVQGKRLAASLQRSVEILIALSTALVLWYGALQVTQGRLSPGELLVFIYYLRRVFRPIRDFTKYTARLAKASAAGERVLELLEQELDVKDRPDAKAAPAFKGELSFEQVGFSYLSGDKQVLHDVDFTVGPGQKAALVGPSGSGKSTVIALLMRLYEPSSGRVLIDGQDIRNYTLDSMRSQISVVMQDTVLFATSIAGNIAIGQQDVSDEAIIRAARLADIHDFIVSLPQGYQTEVGERGVTLSVGQRQRIAIARAAIRNAPILILDEATTGLDPVTEKSVNQALNRLAEGKTTLVVTHRKEIARQCGLIIYLRDGKVAEQGSHQSLTNNGGLYASHFDHNDESGEAG